MPIQPPSSSTQPRGILVRGVNWLGDAVMTTPALSRLRERFPDAHITLLTPQKLADLWRSHPSVDAVMTFASGEGPFSVSRRIRKWHFDQGLVEIEHQLNGSARSNLAETLEGACEDLTEEFVGRLSKSGFAVPGFFDLAIVLPNSPRSALEAWLARIPQRIGYARPWRNLFLTTTIHPRSGVVTMRKLSAKEIRDRARSLSSAPSAPPASSHHMHHYLHLVGSLGASSEALPPSLAIGQEEIASAFEKFRLPLSEAGNRPILGVNPGAEYGPAKRWPADRFIASVREIQKRLNCIVLIFGGKADEPLAGEIELALRASNLPVRNLAGKTSLRELMALLKPCLVLLTNDSGPMHVAAALGTPVVVPFGSTSPELTGPGLPGDRRHVLLRAGAPCSPCFRRECPIDFRCMTGITVEQVVAAVLQVAQRDNC
jgi:heptosyltransferase II